VPARGVVPSRLAIMAIMTKSWFHNRRGERVAMPTFTATHAKNEFGRVLDTAVEMGAVAITRRDAPKAVLLSIGEFDALVSAGERKLDTLTAEFDELLARMQTPRARKGMANAFAATPARLGKAAVTAAKKRG
jgi:antitoxin Phd